MIRCFLPRLTPLGVLVLGGVLVACGGSRTPEDALAAARTQYQGGDYEAARAGFTAVVSDPAATDAVHRKARLYGAACAGFLGDGKAAREEFEQLDAASGQSLGADLYLWAADQFADAGQIEAALHVVELATKRFPEQKGDFERVAKRIAEKGGADAAKKLEGLGYLK